MSRLAALPPSDAHGAFSDGRRRADHRARLSLPEALDAREEDHGASAPTSEHRRSHSGRATIEAASQVPMSVVIPARDAAATLGHVLDALACAGLPLNVVVVDDHSADATARLACRHPLRATVLRLPRRSGPGMARNVGVAVADAATICFLDADMLVSAQALAEHARRADDYVIAQGFRHNLALDTETGALPSAALGVPPDVEADGGAAPRSRANSVDAAFLSLPRAAFLNVGGFDPEFGRGWGYDDAYLGAKLIAAGLEVAPLRRAVGFHLITAHGEVLRRVRQPLERHNFQLYRRLLDAPTVGRGAAWFRQHTNRLLRESLLLA